MVWRAYLGCRGGVDAPDCRFEKAKPGGDCKTKSPTLAEMEAGTGAAGSCSTWAVRRTLNRAGAGDPDICGMQPTAPLVVHADPMRARSAVIAAWLRRYGGPMSRGFQPEIPATMESAQPGHRSFTVVRHPVGAGPCGLCDRSCTGQTDARIARASGAELQGRPAARWVPTFDAAGATRGFPGVSAVC